MIEAKSVLVMEDANSIRAFIRAALSQAGYHVFGAANGFEGLEILASQQIDLVITDILMPEKEGIETIIQIRQLHPELPIVAISGGGRAHNFEPLRIAGGVGADAMLTKPFDINKLIAVVEDVMRKKGGKPVQGRRAL